MDFKRFITPKDLAELKASQPNLKIVDTRTPEEFAEEHIDGAVNVRECFTYLIPNTNPDGVQDLEQNFTRLFSQAGISNGDGEIVVTYEAGMSSGFAQSCRAFFLLSYLGHERVFVLNGGLQAWKAEGFSVKSGAVVPEPAVFKANVKKELLATRADVLQVLSGTSDWVLLDDRDKDEWLGESSSPYGKDFTPRKGRIAGATWIEWYKYMTRAESGAWVMKNKKEISEMLAAAGITPDKKIICYCFKGSRASHTLMCLLECGFTNVRNYFGSWNEWSRDFDLPIDSTLIQE